MFAMVQSDAFAENDAGNASSVSTSAFYTSPTTNTNFLICEVTAVSYINGNVTPPIPSIPSPPTTSGITWLLAAISSVSPSYYDGSYTMVVLSAVYFCANAPSIGTGTAVIGNVAGSFASSSTDLQCCVDIFEASGLGSSVAVNSSVSSVGIASTVSAGNIVPTATSFIFVGGAAAIGGASGTPAAGSGFTLTNNAFNANDDETYSEYIANASPTTYTANFADAGFSVPFAMVAVAFAPVSTPTIIVNGQTLTIPYELAAYQGATLTGPNAYSCAPPILRGIYSTPIFEHDVP